MSFLVAKGKRDNYEFESYAPMPVSNIKGSEGELLQLAAFTRVTKEGNEISHICAVFASDIAPRNERQSWYFKEFFQVSATYKGQTGTADIDLGGPPNTMFYNDEKKVGVVAFGLTNNKPSSIGGYGPSSFFIFSYSDKVSYGVPYLGYYYIGDESKNYTFWERVSHLKPKKAFEIDISIPGGGDGEYDDNTSDTIGLPDLTALNQNSISNTKFLTCYKMTPAQLSKLGDELWSDNIFTQISNTVLKPTDFIVNLSLLPVILCI